MQGVCSSFLGILSECPADQLLTSMANGVWKTLVLFSELRALRSRERK